MARSVTITAAVATSLLLLSGGCDSSDSDDSVGGSPPDAGGPETTLPPSPTGGSDASGPRAADATAEATADAAADADADADAGADADSDAGADASTCPVGAICSGTYNLAFVTSTTQSVTSIGGVAGADALCNARALAAGLPGEYVAWISSTASAAKTRLGTASGWLRVDRRPFAASAEDLFADKLLYPLALDENGAVAPADAVFTATQADGTVSTDNCHDWASTDPGDHAIGGYIGMGSLRWTGGAFMQCNETSRVYCLGKDHAAPLPASAGAGRRAFVTNQTFAPNAGLAAADAACQADATAASLPGTYKALLATSAASPIARFSTTGPTWVRLDGAAIWASATDAAANAPVLAPVLFRADGTRTTFGWLWMGSPALNSVGTDTCGDWASNASTHMGLTAFSDVAGAGPWIDSSLTCDSGIKPRVMCLEE